MPRSASTLKAWDIYAKELRDLGYGHPLWVPEPSPESGEVQLGDVGYLSQGKFCVLFNCMRGANDPVNRRGVPEGFKVFEPPDGPTEESAKSIRNCIMDRMLLSTNAHSLSIQANALLGADPVAHVEGAASYEVKQKMGACLALKRPAHQTSLHCTEAIFRYLQAHHVQWREFARQRRGRKIDSQHILFVSGFVKTAAWAVGAFRHESSSATVKIDAGAMFGTGPSVSAGAAISVANCSEPMSFHRYGPAERLPWENEVLHPDDQCIFLQYAHLKHRFLRAPRVVVTPDTSDDFSYDEVCFGDFSVKETSYADKFLEEIPLEDFPFKDFTDHNEVESAESFPGPLSLQEFGLTLVNTDRSCDNSSDDEDDDDSNDSDTVDEAALDYVLRHCVDAEYACATSQDLYTLRQTRRVWDGSVGATGQEVMPGLQPILLSTFDSEPAGEGSEEQERFRPVAPLIGILRS